MRLGAQKRSVDWQFLERSEFMTVKISPSRALGSRKVGSVVFILAVTVLLANSFILAAEAVKRPTVEPSAGLTRYRVFSLKHISVEQGNKFLTEARVGTVSQLPGTNTILVTAQPDELIKASTILNLVDSERKFVIKAIFPASEAENLPSNDRIAAEVGDISIGTFSNPPADAETGVIIDVHKDAVIAVAPAGQLEKIISAIEQLQKPKVETPEPTEVEKMAVGQIQATVPEQVAAKIEKPGEVAPAGLKGRSYEPEPIANGDEILELTLPEKLSIILLVELVGKYYHLDFLYDPTKITGDVTVKLGGELSGPIKVKDLYPLLESVLKFRGFVMTRKGNLVTIVQAADAPTIDPVLIDDSSGEIQAGDVIITRIFNLRHIDTASAQNLLTGMKLGVSVTPISAAGTLIVTGYAYRMARIEEVLQMIDKPGEPKQFRFRQLRYTMAKTLAPQIKTLAEQIGTVSITIAASPITPSRTPTRPTPTRPTPTRPTPTRPTPPRPTPTPTPAKPAAVFLDADERTNRILMIGLQEQLVVVEQLIDALDVEQQDLRTLQLYEIQHVGAEEAKKKLEELGIIGASRTTSRITVSAPSAKAPTPRPPTPTTTTTTTEALVGEPQVVIIEATNSLLVNATAEQHARITQILGYVDSEMLKEEIPYKIYSLENQSPTDLAGVLNQLVQETIKDKEGKIERVIKKEEEVTIIADETTFSLIVYASKKNQEWISSLIETLDRFRPQVLIDVTLVEVSRTDLFDFDLDVVTKFPKLARSYTQQTDPNGIPIGPKIATGAMDFLTALKEPFPLKRITEAVVTAGAGGTGFYADEHIQALLTAMQTKGYGRVLAKPKILVNDGQPGIIKTTETTNVKIEQIVIPEEGTQRTTTDFRAYEAGIMLTITPNIGEGDLLLLEIELDRSDFGETPEVGAPPDTTATNINTVVTVPNDRTIILGGLIKLNQTKAGSKVPILSDIPILGGLFRSTSNTDRESKLYIFVKANILRPDENIKGLPDLEEISERNRVAFERFEEKFQKYEDWPGMKPEPMEPLRVLEAE